MPLLGGQVPIGKCLRASIPLRRTGSDRYRWSDSDGFAWANSARLSSKRRRAGASRLLFDPGHGLLEGLGWSPGVAAGELEGTEPGTTNFGLCPLHFGTVVIRRAHDHGHVEFWVSFEVRVTRDGRLLFLHDRVGHGSCLGVAAESQERANGGEDDLELHPTQLWRSEDSARGKKDALTANEPSHVVIGRKATSVKGAPARRGTLQANDAGERTGHFGAKGGAEYCKESRYFGLVKYRVTRDLHRCEGTRPFFVYQP
jgi:hypothetical protein